MDRDMDDFYYDHTNTWNECINKLYETKDFSDIVIVAEFGNQSVHFSAHKLILAMSSPFFAEMLCGSKAAGNNHIIIRNIQPKIVEIMLSFIYFRKEIQFQSLEQCFAVLTLATTYELSTLRKLCTNYIEGFIDVEHVCSVYQIAVSVRNRNLVLKSLQFIQKQTKDILKHSSWMGALPVTLLGIVKQEYLNIDSELQLFEAIIDWAKRRLQLDGMANNSERLRQEIEPFLPHIRFLSMNAEIFLRIAAVTRVFTNDEIATIGMNFVQRNLFSLPAWFNRSENCRVYEYKTTENDTHRGNWFNVNKMVYSHSKPVEKISSILKAADNDFAIHQLLIAICDDCFVHNVRSKRMNISIKVTIKVNTLVRETSIVLPIEYIVGHRQTPKFDEKEPVLLARSISGKFFSSKSIGMETHSPIVQAFLDPDTPRFAEVVETCPSTLSKAIDFEPPVLVQSKERFELSIETLYLGEPFFCCKKKPSFEGAPFTVPLVASGTTEDSEVWCAFASLGYSISKEESVLCE